MLAKRRRSRRWWWRRRQIGSKTEWRQQVAETGRDCVSERERETQFAAWSYNTIAWLAGWPMILGEWGHALPWSAQVHRRAIDGLSVSVSLFWSLPIVRPSVATTCPNIGSMATADAAWRHKWPYNDIIHRRHTSSFPPRTRDTMCFDCTFVVESHVRFAVLHTLIHTVS